LPEVHAARLDELTPRALLGILAVRQAVFVVEQNRDGQLRTLIMNEGGVDPAKLVAILNYDGSPITARFITEEISRRMRRPETVSVPQVAE